jgi:hypothetical protein
MCAAAPYATEKVVRLAAAGSSKAGLVLQILKRSLTRGITGGGVAPSSAIALACIESLHARSDLLGEGCCASELDSVDMPLAAGDWEDTEAIVQVVRALDIAGRLNPHLLAQFFAELGRRHPLGVQGATNILYIASSPMLPRPTPPFGSPIVQPLIVGTLNDPATTYAAAQDMAAFFPQGRLLTWQGFLHGFKIVDAPPDLEHAKRTRFENGGIGAYVCTQLVKRYLLTGHLPRDGTVCPIDGPGASALSIDVALAHAGDSAVHGVRGAAREAGRMCL